jgi:CheY-like chemotaxis protein
VKLLIADDSALLRKSLVKLLQPMNIDFDILEASNIPATIDAITLYYPDILILDLHFPEGYGYEVMDYILNHDLDLVVIILTNLASKDNETRCYSKGANHFLDKTHEYDKLTDVISRYA